MGKRAQFYKVDYLGRNHYNGDTYSVRNFLGLIQGKEAPWTTAEAAIDSEELGLAAVRGVKSRQLEPINLNKNNACATQVNNLSKIKK